MFQTEDDLKGWTKEYKMMINSKCESCKSTLVELNSKNGLLLKVDELRYHN